MKPRRCILASASSALLEPWLSGYDTTQVTEKQRKSSVSADMSVIDDVVSVDRHVILAAAVDPLRLCKSGIATMARSAYADTPMPGLGGK